MIMILGIPVVVGTAGAVGFGALVYGNLDGTIPEPKPQRRLEPSHVYLLNADGTRGEEIASFREFEVALPMKREDVPQILNDALVASEDRQFWSHKCVDPFGIGRAAYIDVTEGSTRQGGSTITQQLVREKFLTREQTIERKFNEVLLATRYERDLVDQVIRETGLDQERAEREAKERILFDYLSVIYFGAGAYGAQAAAQTYFHKNVSELTVSEAAVLVSVIPSPSMYSPRENVTLAEFRRKLVLGSMLDVHLLTQTEHDDAVNQTLWVSGYGPPPRPMAVIFPPPSNSNGKYPYYVDYINKYLGQKYGEDELYHGGLEIYAAIDPRLQAAADAAVANTLSGTEYPLEMSLVSVEPQTGQVRALVGGRDFEKQRVNLALSGSLSASNGFPPGSSYKAFVVARALEERMTEKKAYTIGDTYVPKGCPRADCVIHNSEANEGGYTDMLKGTALSVNTYFVPLIEEVGPQEVAELANRVGVSRIKPAEKTYDYQQAVGRYEVSPLDMAVGYATFANRGTHAEPSPVAKVLKSDGTVLEDNTKPHGTLVMEPAVADATNHVLRTPIERGTARGAVKLDRPAAGKTGTYDSHMAAWFVGHVPQLSTAVWMGYATKLAPLRNIKGVRDVFGGGFPAETWNAYMVEALKESPVIDFVPPTPLAPVASNNGPPVAGAPPVVMEDVRKPGGNRPRIEEVPADCGGPCVATALRSEASSGPPPTSSSRASGCRASTRGQPATRTS